MRDFNFKDDANTSAADIAGVRPLETPPEILTLDETPREDSLRPFHVEQDEEESSNLPKIVGAAVVGLLLVGGGLYAYETSFAHRAPVKTVATQTTTPTNNMASTAPLPAAPENNVAPPTTMREPAAPSAPVKSAPVKSASAIPAPTPEPVRQSASSTPGVGIGRTDDPAINAPMTYTADNAPPAQQPGTSGQTAAASQPATLALQQPIIAPNVGETLQPTAALANNQASGVTLPSGIASNASQSAAQAPQPAQVQPAQIQPAQPAAQ